jgi:O-antigen ligase
VNRALAIGLVLAVSASIFQLGGAAGGAAPLLVALGAALAFVQALRGVRSPTRLEPRLVLVLGLALVPLGVAALELVPLPRAVVASVAPATEALYEKDDAAAGGAPGARTVSLEPGTSRRLLERGVALLAIFALAAGIARRREDGRLLVLGLLLLGAIVALAGLGLPDPAKVTNEAWAGRAHEPFKNPNHFSTFLEILLPLALGVALAAPSTAKRVPPSWEGLGERPDLVVRVLAALAAALFAGGVVQSQSRAGAIAAAVGTVVTLVAANALGRRRLGFATLLVVALAVGVSHVNFKEQLKRFDVTLDAARPSLSTEAFEARAQYWRIAVRITKGRALTGSGLGTFDALSFAALTSENVTNLGSKPERAHNDYLELASSLGWPAALAGVGAVVFALATLVARGRAARSEPRALAAGALGGVAAALVHELFDFGLQMAPIAATFSIVLGVGLGLVGSEDEAPGGRRWSRALAAVLLAALAIVSLVDFVGERAAESAGDDLAAIGSARGWLRDDVALAEREARIARRESERPRAEASRLLESAIEAGRSAVSLAPASAWAQAELALALVERAGAEPPRPELRAEGERRLALALELGPSWGLLHLSAGCYWLGRTAETNDREAAARARREFHEAIRLQLPDQPSSKEEACARVKTLLREGRLGALGEELLADLTTKD